MNLSRFSQHCNIAKAMQKVQTALGRAKRIDAACDQFEADFKSGRSPRIDDFVAHASEADRDALRSALREVEQELRERGMFDTSVARDNPVTIVEHASDGDALDPS